MGRSNVYSRHSYSDSLSEVGEGGQGIVGASGRNADGVIGARREKQAGAGAIAGRGDHHRIFLPCVFDR